VCCVLPVVYQTVCCVEMVCQTVNCVPVVCQTVSCVPVVCQKVSCVPVVRLPGDPKKREASKRKVHCHLMQNLKDNYDLWVKVLKQEMEEKEREALKLPEDKSVVGAHPALAHFYPLTFCMNMFLVGRGAVGLCHGCNVDPHTVGILILTNTVIIY